jgi:hypothetical protein
LPLNSCLCANCRNFINPDLLARAYSLFDPDAALLRAGRVQCIAEFARAGARFRLRNHTVGPHLYLPLLRLKETNDSTRRISVMQAMVLSAARAARSGQLRA